MKKVSLVLGLLVLFTPLAAQTLVAWYPFSGNANDASGNGNHLTVNGPLLTADRFGNASSAYRFDGVDDFMEAAADMLPSGDRTISFWFNADPGSISSRPGLLGYGGNGSCGSSFFMGINNSPLASGNYQIQSHCNTNQLLYAYPSVPENSWYNWVVTISGTTSRMYINGVLRATGTYSSATLVTGARLSLGAIVSPAGSANYVDGNITRFKGVLDDIRIYSGALTETQVFESYLNKTPGSGKAFLLDGANDYFTTPTNGYTGAQTYTIETWIRKNSATTTNFIWENESPLSAPSLESNGSQFLFYVGGSSSLSTGPLDENKWYHIACQYDKVAQVQRLYVNGILKGTNAVNVSDAIENKLFFGSRTGNQFFFDGQIDEIRVWNTTLTQTQIRNWMCRKLDPSHPAWNNLVTYLRADEMNGTTVMDLKGQNDATLFNGTSLSLSGAALGDASAYDYVSIPTVNLSHPQGEEFEARITSGTVGGMQVYRVDGRPNNTNGAPGIGINDRYFGVYLIEGASPVYTLTYTYDGNPFITASNETDLKLYKRNDNATPVWTDASATLNTSMKTLVATGQNTEYILGLNSGILPVQFSSFTARKLDNTVQLNWTTAAEKNNKGFEVQRSFNGSDFTILGFVPGLTSLTGEKTYLFTDLHPGIGRNLYRLKQIDETGAVGFSEIRMIQFGPGKKILVYPNPSASTLTLLLSEEVATEVRIFNNQGQVMWRKKGNSACWNLDVGYLPAGIYHLELHTLSGRVYQEMFIRK